MCVGNHGSELVQGVVQIVHPSPFSSVDVQSHMLSGKRRLIGKFRQKKPLVICTSETFTSDTLIADLLILAALFRLVAFSLDICEPPPDERTGGPGGIFAPE